MSVAILKLNPQRQETWRYNGHILLQEPTVRVIEARFNRADLPFHGITFRQNDRFVEIYYSDRWYNIFEIHDRDSDALKGWYCNICCPAEFSQEAIAFVDLALDLLVYPDGRQLVLDEDEFAALALAPDIQARARHALAELQTLFQQAGPGQPPDPAHAIRPVTL